MAKKYTITLGTVLNGDKPCESPSVDILGYGDLLVKCIDKNKGIYEVEVGDDDALDNCLTFVIGCDACSGCPPIEVRKCLCEDNSQCGDCETCSGGLCESQCASGEFCESDTCVECNEEVPCTNGQVCKNGQCICPSGRPFLVDGECKECLGDTVENCRKCVNGEFEPINCPGVCDPTSNQCVDCLISTDCDGINECCKDRVCDCCEGFIRNSQGICEPAPECQFEEDCSDCETCNGGRCEPMVCPPGKQCVPTFGCVEECDCNSTDPCSDPTKKCENGVGGGCGCIDCEGTCESGCGDGCYCNGDECVGDVCADGQCPCTNGADCPDGYGCQDGNCVPCVAQSCSTGECSGTLGCDCAGNTCIDVDSACQNTACASTADCGVGCTCYQGECVSCENFDCTECNRPGCGCQGNACVGDNTPCTDTFELTKDDENCDITAELVKSECCSCGKVTVDVRGKTVNTTDTTVEVTFIAEVRKGAYDTSVVSLPLLDDTANPDIADNDAPIAGGVKLTGLIQFSDYEIRQDAFGNDVRVFIGNSEAAIETQRVGFSTSGDVASREFNTVVLHKIGSEIIDGDIIRVVRSVTVNFEVDTTFSFPNECNYRYLGPIGSYPISNNTKYEEFRSTYSNEIARTLSSQDCRLPLFTWIKSDDGDFNEAPFRKLYIEGVGNVFTDTISTRAEGAESCKHFLVETDCSCADDPNDYIVLCNPEDITFEVERCNLEFTLKSFDTCEVNEDKTYFIKAGSLNITFTKDSAPIDQKFTSNTQIFNVEFGMQCDVEGACTKNYTVAPEYGNTEGLSLNLAPVCSSTGQTAELFIPPNDITGRCSLVEVEINGVIYFPNTFTDLAPGSYNAVAVWSCGCEPTAQQFTIECCDAEIPNIERDCSGVIACEELPGAEYYDGNTLIPAGTVCQYVSELELGSGTTLTVRYNDCLDGSVTIPPVLDECCAGFTASASVTGSTAVVTVNGDTSPTVLVSSGSSNGLIPNILELGNYSYEVSPLVAGNDYTITVISSQGCDLFTTVVTAGASVDDCDLEVTLDTVSGGNNLCLLEATTDQEACPCEQGSWDMVLTDVGEVDNSTFSVRYALEASGFEADVLTSIVYLDDVSGSSPQENLQLQPNGSASGVFTVDKVFTQGPNANIGGVMTYTVATNTNGAVITARVTSIQSRDDIESLTITASGGGSVTQQNPFDQAFIIPSTLQSGDQELVLTFNLVGGGTRTNTHDVSVESNQSITLPIDITFPTRVEGFATITVSLSNLRLEDNCEYGQVNTNFRVKSDGTFFSGINNVSKPLEPTSENVRKKFFEWKRDSIVVFSEYQLSTSALPTNLLKQGSQYDVKATCDPCEASDSLTLCCEIQLDAVGDACGLKADVEIRAIPGIYTVELTGVETRTVEVGQSGYLLESFEGVAAGSYNGYVQPQGIESCRETFTVTTYEAPVALLSITTNEFTLSSFNAGTIDATVSYCLKTEQGTVSTFSTNPPVGQTFPNPTNGVIRLVTNCGTDKECETFFAPSPNTCLGTTVTYNIDYSGPAGQVTFEAATSNATCNVASINVTGGGVNITFGPGQARAFAEGTYNYSATLTCACPPVTGTFTIKDGDTPALSAQNTFDNKSFTSGCGNDVEVEQARVSNEATMIGYLTETSCDCDGDEFTAEVTNVAESGGNISFDLDTFIEGDLEIGSTVMRVIVDGGTNQVVNHGPVKVQIPKVTTNATQDVNLTVDVVIEERQDGNGDTFIFLDDVIFRERNPAIGDGLIDRNMQNVVIVIDDGIRSPEQYAGVFASDGGGGLETSMFTNYIWTANSMTLAIMDYTLTDDDGLTYTGQIRVELGTNPSDGTTSYDETGNSATVITEVDQTIRIKATQLTAVNGCPYVDSTVGDFVINSSGIVSSPGSTTETLVTSNGSIKPNIKATWTTNGNVVFEEYSTTGTSVLPASVAILGETYELEGSCVDCTASISEPLCSNITGSVILSVCYDTTEFTFDLPKNETYSVTFQGQTLNVSRPVSGPAIVTFNTTPLADNFTYAVTVQPLGAAVCSQQFQFTTSTKDGTC